MRIVLTGSLGNIGALLTQHLVDANHQVTVISSKPERKQAIEAIGAAAAIGSICDVDFLTRTFCGADVVYLMETMEAVGDIFDPRIDFIAAITAIGCNYKTAVTLSGVKQVVHLSSIGADMDVGNGILLFHRRVEQVLLQLPMQVAIKFIRPVGFYTNLFASIPTIKKEGLMRSNYAGDTKETWVSPLDIAEVIAEEINLPFQGRSVRYVASDEVSPVEIAATLGRAIGMPDLQWQVVSDAELLQKWLAMGFNPQVAHGFIEMQASQRSGLLYGDYYRHRPKLGKVKLADFAVEFAKQYAE